MAWAKMTLIGMNAYLNAEGEDLFKDLNLPADLDKDTAVETIFMVAGEFPILWSNPYFVQAMIGIWSKKQQTSFARMAKAWTEEYNPLHNYDRYEDWTDSEKAGSSSTANNTHSVTGYDSDNLRTNDADSGGTTASANRDGTHKGHLYGNIGVTTSQQMLEAEMDLARDYNPYQLIADMFKNEFCILVY